MTHISPFRSLTDYRRLVSIPFPALNTLNSSLWTNSKLTQYVNSKYYVDCRNNRIRFFTYVEAPCRNLENYKAARAFVGFTGEVDRTLQGRDYKKFSDKIFEAYASSLPLLSSFLTGSKQLGQHAANWFMTSRNESIDLNKEVNLFDKKSLKRQLDEKYMDSVMDTIANFRNQTAEVLKQNNLKNPQGLVAVANVNSNGYKYLFAEAVKFQGETTADPFANIICAKTNYYTVMVRQSPETGEGYPEISIAPQRSYKELNEDEMTHLYAGGVKLIISGFSNEPQDISPEYSKNSSSKPNYALNEKDIEICLTEQNAIFNQIVNSQ